MNDFLLIVNNEMVTFEYFFSKFEDFFLMFIHIYSVVQ